MPAKFAARLGDTTAHLFFPLMPGPGAAIPPKTVLINSKPALRAGLDTNMCSCPIAPPAPAPHGPEKCPMGSMTVLINGAMAVRVGDIWIAAGPPNSVVKGSLNVMIGDVAFGLSADANMAEFCADFAQLQKDWPGLTPDERKTRMEVMLNKQLAKSGCPPIGVNSEPSLSGSDTNGQFDFEKWNVDVNPDLLNKNALSGRDGKELANTLYHEARHTEQWWNIARTRAGAGATDVQIRDGMGIPLNQATAAVASPVAGNSPEAVMGRAMDESIYGSNSARRNDILSESGDYDQYRSLAEEQDAWNAGDSLPCGK